jgi:hypothetical protein
MVDPEFNNDDNGYGKIKMLYKSNLGNPGEKKTTEEVNMVPCEDFSQDLYENNYLCPDWSDEHVLFTNY